MFQFYIIESFHFMAISTLVVGQCASNDFLHIHDDRVDDDGLNLIQLKKNILRFIALAS